MPHSPNPRRAEAPTSQSHPSGQIRPASVDAQAALLKAFAAERKISLLRLLVILSGTLIYPLMNQEGTVPWLGYSLLAAAWAYGLYVYLAEPYRRFPVLLSSYFTSASDASLTMLWLYATGGYESPFFVALYLAVVGVAFRFGLLQTGFAALVYGGSYLVLLGYLGELAPHADVVAVRVVYIALAAALGYMISNEVLSQHKSRLKMEAVTQRAQAAEQALREQMALHENLARAQSEVGEGVAITEGAGFVYTNDALCAMYGYTREELLALPSFLELVEPAERAGLVERMKARLTGQATSDSGEVTIIRKDGRRIRIAYGVKPVQLKGKNQLVSIIRDVTQVRRAEADLRRATSQLNEAQRMARIGNWEWDIRADRVQCSDELVRVYGLSSSFELAYDDLFRCIHPEDQAFAKASMDESVAKCRPFSFDHRITRPDGTVRWLHARGQVIVDENGRAARIIATAQDITDRRRAEEDRIRAMEALKELERVKELDGLKTQFINMAAHELSTPLTPLKLQAHLLKDSPAAHENPDVRRSSDVITRNVNRLAALVEDIMDASRLQGSHLGLHKGTLDIVHLVQESVETFQAPATEAGIDLQFAQPPPHLIEGDAQRIGQVLYNLIHNAIKFTPHGGVVQVEVVPRSEAVDVLVRDSGVGMTSEQQARLFQPFTQVHEASRQRRRGTGLGLYISRGIIELHGGAMWCESPGPGLGSTFAFSLPKTVATTVPSHPAPAVAAQNVSVRRKEIAAAAHET